LFAIEFKLDQLIYNTRHLLGPNYVKNGLPLQIKKEQLCPDWQPYARISLLNARRIKLEQIYFFVNYLKTTLTFKNF
jgi:hypothetical protein